MSSYLSNILTNTTSKYNTLRANLTSSETDGDTEDDSHISRVLRAYYTEKGRSLPTWLPPDPKHQSRTNTLTSQPSFSSSLRGHSSGSNNSAMQGGSVGRAGAAGAAGQGRGGLSDLWDPPQAPAGQAQPRGGAAGQPLSLRRQAADRSGGSAGLQPNGGAGQPSTSTRGLLPSQRAGSYQNVVNQQQAQGGGYERPSQLQSSPSTNSVGSAAGGGTAQERLKARLWGRGGSATNLHAQGGHQAAGAPQQQNLYAPRDRFAGGAAR
ncbi:hypothetical protein AAFC00_005118 [Neodothiora populina]|uniref:Mso1 N-terminal domain-containing protein n=1 Tax=Neodothiora populina TaxID=2781224 RepID=A0ABR3PK81_9PEZI